MNVIEPTRRPDDRKGWQQPELRRIEGRAAEGAFGVAGTDAGIYS